MGKEQSPQVPAPTLACAGGPGDTRRNVSPGTFCYFSVTKSRPRSNQGTYVQSEPRTKAKDPPGLRPPSADGAPLRINENRGGEPTGKDAPSFARHHAQVGKPSEKDEPSSNPNAAKCELRNSGKSAKPPGLCTHVSVCGGSGGHTSQRVPRDLLLLFGHEK